MFLPQVTILYNLYFLLTVKIRLFMHSTSSLLAFALESVELYIDLVQKILG